MYRECRHIFLGGRKCQSPALTDQPFCYFHSNTRKRPRPGTEPYEPYIAPNENLLMLPILEDAQAIQLALSDIILALAANRIDPRRARILIYGLQVASQNLRHNTSHCHPDRSASARSGGTCSSHGGPFKPAVGLSGCVSDMVRETHRHEDGTIIGPEKESPDPEEIKEKKRPPSLGELLLKDVEEMRRQREAAGIKDEDDEDEDNEDESNLPWIEAVADKPSKIPSHRSPKKKKRQKQGVPHPLRSKGWDPSPAHSAVKLYSRTLAHLASWR